MKKRILSLLLAAVMLLSLLPAGVLAAEDGKVSVTLSGLHSAQVNSLQLYTYTNGQKGTDNLLPQKGADEKTLPATPSTLRPALTGSTATM